MSSNKLYNFIQKFVFKNDKQQVDKATLFQKTHLNGTSYYLLQLPKGKNKFHEGLTLTNHHISIYEQSLHTIDTKSEYHYTVTFKDQQKRSYRLHVYFNHLDETVSAPQLSLEIGDQQYGLIDTDEFEVDWFALSQEAMSSVITQLREEQHRQCTLFKNRIELLDKRTTQLSVDLTRNKKQYLKTLAQQIELKTQLNAINSKEDRQKEIALLQTIYQQVDSEVPSRTVAPKKTKKEVSSSTKLIKTDASNEEKAVTSLKKQGRSSNETKVKEEKYDQKINNLSEKLFELRAIVNESEKTSAIQVIFQQISELQLIIPSSQSNLVQTLEKMEQSVLTIGTKHLHLLLSKNKFDEALQLRALFPMALDNTIFNRALMELNADLIDFLLKNGTYKLEQFEPKTNKKTYGSILEYLFQLDLRSSKVAQCLDILLNHKMSLLRNNSDGLPFILPLIESENHPLSQIIIKNLKNSSENLRPLKLIMDYFCTQLKNCLTNTTQYCRISNAFDVMTKLYRDLSKELQLKKQPSKKNLLPNLDFLEQTLSAIDMLITPPTTPLTTGLLATMQDGTRVDDSQKSIGNSQAGDIYGGLGIFKLPELSIKSSTQEEGFESMMKRMDE